MKRIHVLNGASLDLVERIKHGGSGACIAAASLAHPPFLHTLHVSLFAAQNECREAHTHTHFAPRRNYMLLFNLSCQGERARLRSSPFLSRRRAPRGLICYRCMRIYILYTDLLSFSPPVKTRRRRARHYKFKHFPDCCFQIEIYIRSAVALTGETKEQAPCTPRCETSRFSYSAAELLLSGNFREYSPALQAQKCAIFLTESGEFRWLYTL
jgi:hypothetical protein